MNSPKKIIIDREAPTHERNRLYTIGAKHKIEVFIANDKYSSLGVAKEEPETLFFGSVKWSEVVLGKRIRPNYFPNFVYPYLHRPIWYSNDYPKIDGIFVKPADQYKRYNGHFSSLLDKQDGPCWCSGPLNLDTIEWRLYVLDGEIVLCSCYSHEADWNEQQPDIKNAGIKGINKNWSGTIDVGWDKDLQKYVVLECHHPFACGWYGDNTTDLLFLYFLSRGWTYMLNL